MQKIEKYKNWTLVINEFKGKIKILINELRVFGWFHRDVDGTWIYESGVSKRGEDGKWSHNPDVEDESLKACEGFLNMGSLVSPSVTAEEATAEEATAEEAAAEENKVTVEDSLADGEKEESNPSWLDR